MYKYSKGIDYTYTFSKKRNVFLLRFDKDGYSWKTTKTVKTTDENEAIQFAEEFLENRENAWKYITFGEYAKGFYDDDNFYCKNRAREKRDLSPGTLISKRQKLRDYVLPRLRNTKIIDIRLKTIIEFRDQIIDETDLMPATINDILYVINDILSMAVIDDIISVVPKMPKLSRSKDVKRGILNRDELIKLFSEEVWDDYKAYVAFCLSTLTGARQGEIMALNILDIFHCSKQEVQYIHIYKSYEKNKKYIKSTKTNENRIVPINDFLFEKLNKLTQLNKWKSHDSYLFFSDYRDDRPVDHKVFLKWFYRAMEKIGISKEERIERNIVFHSLRHQANTMMRDSGIGDEKVMRVLGHNRIDTNNNYYHQQISELPEFVDFQDNLLSDTGKMIGTTH